MSAPINTGGPAFPSGELVFDEGDCKTAYYNGMNLRDWFAGMALSGLYASRDLQLATLHDHRSDGFETIMSQQAYRQADAMLAEREKGGAI